MNTSTNTGFARGADSLRHDRWRSVILGVLICGASACHTEQSREPVAPPPPLAEPLFALPPPAQPMQAAPPQSVETAAGASAPRHQHSSPHAPPDSTAHAVQPISSPVMAAAPPPAEAAPTAGAAAPPAVITPHYLISAPQQPLHGPENKDITLLLSLDLPADQIQAYYDGHFKAAETPAQTHDDTLDGFKASFTRLRATIDCGDGHILRCTPMEGYPGDIDSQSGVLAWRWNIVGVDDPQATGTRPQSVRIVVLGASDGVNFERIDSIPDIPLEVSVEPLTRVERLIAIWTNLAVSIKALLVAVIALIGVITAWFTSTFKKRATPAA